jgi:hypothetical protein
MRTYSISEKRLKTDDQSSDFNMFSNDQSENAMNAKSAQIIDIETMWAQLVALSKAKQGK